MTVTVVAEGCFTHQGNDYRATSDVRVNGIDFTPGPGGSVTVITSQRRIALAGSGLIHAGDIPLEAWSGPGSFDLSGSSATVPLAGALGIGANLFGFPFAAPVTITWGSKASSQISATVSLSVLGDSVGGSVALGTSNSTGLQINNITVSVNGGNRATSKSYRPGVFCYPSKPPPAGWQCDPNQGDPTHGTLQKSQGQVVNVGGVLPVQNLSCSYMRVNQQGNLGAAGSGEWSCNGVFGLGGLFPGALSGGQIPSLSLGAGIQVNPFQFDYASAGVQGLNLPVGGFAVLHSVNFTLRLHPLFEIDGKINLGAGPPVSEDLNNRLLSIDGEVDFQIGPPKQDGSRGFKLTITGKISVPQLGQQVGMATATWNSESTSNQFTISLTAMINVANLISGKAHVGGSVTSQHYQAFGDATVTLLGQSISGHLAASDAGIGACGTLHVLLFNGSIGAEYIYKQHQWDYEGCDFSALYTLGSAGTTAAGHAAARVLRVPRGTSRIEVAALGASAPPDVELIGPGGVRVSTPATPDRITVSGHVMAVAVTQSRRTYFVVDHPAPGRWHVVSVPGAAPPVSVMIAQPLVPVHPHVSVSGRGTRRVLHWHLRAQRGVSVQFIERGPGVLSTIATERAAGGSVGFHPAPGPGGRRAILALVTVDGIPRGKEIVIGHYVAPAPSRPRVRGARYENTGKTVIVVFDRAPGATGYEVTVALKHGLYIRRMLGPGRLAAAIVLPPGRTLGHVTVAAIEHGLLGPASTAYQDEVQAASSARKRQQVARRALRRRVDLGLAGGLSRGERACRVGTTRRRAPPGNRSRRR